MRKSIFILCLIICITFSASAQSSTNNLLGLYGCASLNRFMSSQQFGSNMPSDNLPGYTAGIIYQRRIYKGIFVETGIWDAAISYEIDNKNAFKESASMINPALQQNFIFDYKKSYNIMQIPLLAEYYFEFKRFSIGLGFGVVGNQILQMHEYNDNLRRPDLMEKEKWFYIGYKSQVSGRYMFSRHWAGELQFGTSGSHNKGFLETRLSIDAGLALMYSL